jgi:hypothetical protein
LGSWVTATPTISPWADSFGYAGEVLWEIVAQSVKVCPVALDEETDGRLGYQVLKDSGVIPNEQETLAEHVSRTEACQNPENKLGVKRYLHALADIECTAPRFGKSLGEIGATIYFDKA